MLKASGTVSLHTVYQVDGSVSWYPLKCREEEREEEEGRRKRRKRRKRKQQLSPLMVEQKCQLASPLLTKLHRH